MSFVIIWDTCTQPQYYSDLHNVLASPEEMICRYDYSSKYFDGKSRALFQQLKNKKIKKIDVLLCYGELEGFSQNADQPTPTDVVDVFIPFRLGEVINCEEITNSENSSDSKLVYDIRLKKYPDPKLLDDSFNWKLSELFKDKIPFKYWHTCVEDSEMWTAFNVTGVKQSSANWYSIVSKLLKTQFRDDTFWRLEFSSLKVGGEVPKFESFDKNLNITNNALSLSDDEDVFFKITYKNSPSSSKKKRLINISSTDNIVCNRDSVEIRPYSVIDFHIRGSTDQYLKKELASIDLLTIQNEQDEGYPVGPNLRIHAKISKSKKKLFSGIIIGSVSLAIFTISAKFPMVDSTNTLDFCKIFKAGSLLALSSIGVLISGFLLRKEFKLK